MSTIKSSDEHLTLNADGTSKDIKFQANGVEKASISSAGAFTSTTIDATKLTGDLPAISGSSLTGVADATKLPLAGGNVTGDLQVSGKLSSAGAAHADSQVMIYTSDATDNGLRINMGSGSYTGTALEVQIAKQSGEDTYTLCKMISKHDNASPATRFSVRGDGLTTVDGILNVKTGITFASDTAAENTLDDYEEGTWSPVLTGSNNTSHNTGRYTKIGKQVIIEGDFRCTSYSNSGSTAVTITGMPYAVANISNYNVTGPIYTVNGFNQTNDHGYILYAGANQTTISIYGQNQSTGVNYNILKRSEMTSGIVEVFFTMHYTTN